MASIACLGLMLSTQNINAQTVSDFENLTLAPNTYFDGSDMSGSHSNKQFSTIFISGDVNFINVFDTTFGAPGYWLSGFSYSNMTDSTTSGSANRFSARAGSGVNNSSNYIVSQNNSTIVLKGSAASNTVKGVYVTNSTYAANSMRDGDAFAKQFGGASGNDADWFLLTIKGYTNGNLTTDSVDFYLADYRFSNNAQDYIVKDWQWVDLTSLGVIDSVYFSLTSSDVGGFGMNTPGFFCIDNFNDQSVGVNDVVATTEGFSFYPNPATNVLNVVTADKLVSATIYSVNGALVKTATNKAIDVSDLDKGMYLLTVQTTNGVTQTRFIKE